MKRVHQRGNVGIIGLGFVGSAIQYGLTRAGNRVVGYDIKMPETSLQDVLRTEVIFLCVPTPQSKDGSCDTSIVEQVVKNLAKEQYGGLIVIKSTVEPGTTDRLSLQYPKLKLAFCPEFLRARSSRADFLERNDVCIIGAYNGVEADIIRAVHGSLPKKFAVVRPIEAELAKYFMNVFNALRIVFANQFYDVCQESNADYQKVKNAIVQHRVIPDIYLDCNEDLRGFGGACLPKDTAAFAQYTKKLLGTPDGLSLFETIVELNKQYKTTVI